MTRNQAYKLVGYIVFTVEGEHVMRFLQMCQQHYIPIWDLEKERLNRITCKAYYKDAKRLKSLAKQMDLAFETSIVNGLLLRIVDSLKKKAFLFSFLFSFMVLFALSNIVWTITYSGVPTNLEQNLEKQLHKHGLYEGAFSFNLVSLDVIQHEILNEMPSLLYIGIEKKGTSYHVAVIEKLNEKKAEENDTKELIAKKSGIIEKMYVTSGISLVSVNDYVKKGDILVSGDERKLEEDGTDEKDVKEREEMTVEGEVFAQVWYEVDVETPLHIEESRLDGERKDKYTLGIGSFVLPIPNYNKRIFTDEFTSVDKEAIYFLKWKTPIQLYHKSIYNKVTLESEKTVEKRKQKAIEVALNDLLLKTGNKTELNTYYILHETVSNGKVKLKLYVNLIEDIT